MGDWFASVALGRDDSLDFGAGDLLANGISVVALVGEKRLDLVGGHPEQRREALGIVRLSGRQDEAERSAFRIAPGMELGCKTAARSAKRLDLLSPLTWGYLSQGCCSCYISILHPIGIQVLSHTA